MTGIQLYVGYDHSIVPLEPGQTVAALHNSISSSLSMTDDTYRMYRMVPVHADDVITDTDTLCCVLTSTCYSSLQQQVSETASLQLRLDRTMDVLKEMEDDMIDLQHKLTAAKAFKEHAASALQQLRSEYSALAKDIMLRDMSARSNNSASSTPRSQTTLSPRTDNVGNAVASNNTNNAGNGPLKFSLDFSKLQNNSAHNQNQNIVPQPPPSVPASGHAPRPRLSASARPDSSSSAHSNSNGGNHGSSGVVHGTSSATATAHSSMGRTRLELVVGRLSDPAFLHELEHMDDDVFGQRLAEFLGHARQSLPSEKLSF